MEMKSGALVVSLSANGVWAQRRDPGAGPYSGWRLAAGASREVGGV